VPYKRRKKTSVNSLLASQQLKDLRDSSNAEKRRYSIAEATWDLLRSNGKFFRSIDGQGYYWTVTMIV